MKIMIAGDIHGCADYCRDLLALFERERPQKLVLLGDILYHGPRNGVVDGYEKTRPDLIQCNKGCA